jgi:hypothetical protein
METEAAASEEPKDNRRAAKGDDEVRQKGADLLWKDVT